MDTNWCCFCDRSINIFSNALYCSEQCMRQDALEHSPLLGYDFSEYREFSLTNSIDRRRSSFNWTKDDDNEPVNIEQNNYSSSHQMNYTIPSLSTSLSTNTSSIIYNNNSQYNHQHHYDDQPVSQQQPQQPQQQRKDSLIVIRRLNLFSQSL